jgi:RNA polymerase sigma-70 factor, ECF subfamily
VCERRGVGVGLSRDERLRSLARDFTPQVASYLYRRAYPLTTAEIDDLVEEVLVIVWRRLDDVPEGAELPWMIGVARNVLNNARRKHSRRRSAHERLRPRGDAASAEDSVAANEQLRDALGALGEADREILLLHYWDGFDAAALAASFSISEGAAATRLSRATERFRTAFARAAGHDVKDGLERTREG